MRSKPRDLGTNYESARVAYWNNRGIAAARLAEGGQTDLGDLWLSHHPDSDTDGVGWIEESKARERLNPHQTLDQAIDKAGHKRVLLAHKRLVRKPGHQRRTPDGLPEIVAMHPDTATALLVAFHALEEIAPDSTRDILSSLEVD